MKSYQFDTDIARLYGGRRILIIMEIAMNPPQMNWYGTYFKLFVDILPDMKKWITTKSWEDMAIELGTINNTDNSYNCFRK